MKAAPPPAALGWGTGVGQPFGFILPMAFPSILNKGAPSPELGAERLRWRNAIFCESRVCVLGVGLVCFFSFGKR